MSRSTKTSFLIVVFLAGVMGAGVYQDSLGWFLGVSLGVGLGGYGVLVWGSRRFLGRAMEFNFGRCLGIFLVLLAGVMRFWWANPDVTTQDLLFYNDREERVVLRGMIVVEPDVRAQMIKLTVGVQEIAIGGSGQAGVPDFREVKGRVLVNLSRYPEYNYGDFLELTGFLETPPEFEDFSYKNYLARYNVYSIMNRARVKVLDQGQGNGFLAGIFWIKAGFEGVLNRIFPEPYASFTGGLLLGSRRGIPESLMEKFNITGLTHIIAISGYNITLVIVFMTGLLRGFSRRVSVPLASVAIIVFTILVGASAAVVRAAIMGVLGLIAIWVGRKSQVTLTILVAAFFMVAWNPKILVYDVGFQLSLAATLGLVYISPYFEEWGKRVFRGAVRSEVVLSAPAAGKSSGEKSSAPAPGGTVQGKSSAPGAFASAIKEGILMTLSAQVTSLPIILLNFGRLSVVSPLANALVVGLIPMAMFFGFGAGLLGVLAGILAIFWYLALAVGYGAWFFLELIIQLVGWFAKIPYASVDVVGVQSWMVIVYYLALAGWLGRRSFLHFINPDRA